MPITRRGDEPNVFTAHFDISFQDCERSKASPCLVSFHICAQNTSLGVKVTDSRASFFSLWFEIIFWTISWLLFRLRSCTYQKSVFSQMGTNRQRKCTIVCFFPHKKWSKDLEKIETGILWPLKVGESIVPTFSSTKTVEYLPISP